jgi:dTDP-4-dehydrorhamnose reductase
VKRILVTGATSFLGSKFIEMFSGIYEIRGISKNDPHYPVDLLDKNAVLRVYEEYNPDVIVHTAAIVDQDANRVKVPNILSTKNLVEVAKAKNTPIIFSSSESVYGGKEKTGEYVEDDPYKPRSAYGETKVESEKIIINSGLNYLFTRCHRYVGFNKHYTKPKQFPDTMRALISGNQVALDDHKLFKPCLINHISEVYRYYIDNEMDKKIILNLGVDEPVTYFQLIKDVAATLELNSELVLPGGNEASWPENSTLSVEKLKNSTFPQLDYAELLSTLKSDYYNQQLF